MLALVMLMIPVLASCDSGDDPVDSGTNNAPTTGTPDTGDGPVVDPDAPYAIEGDFGYEELEDGTVKILVYLGKGGDVTVPGTIAGKTVTKLGLMSFASNFSITSVTLPGSLVDTGELSFYDCEALTSVTIGEGVTTIARGSFNFCKALSSVSLPSTVTRIEEIAFQGCKALTAIEFPDSVSFIGMRAFANCGLLRVDMPSSLQAVEREVFLGCEALTEVIFNSSMSHLASDFFAYCYSLKNVKLPEGMRYLDNSLFWRCTSLESFVFPDTLRGASGERVFYGCQALKEVYIPAACSDPEDDLDIGYYSFWFVPALTDVYFGGTQDQWDGLLNGIGTFNDTLIEATIHLGAAMPES